MPKSRKKAVVNLQISQGSKNITRNLHSRESLTIGKSPKNDIVVYGDSFPRSLRLMDCSDSGCTLRFDSHVRGEINFQDAQLDLHSLMVHELLPVKDGYCQLQIQHGRRGRIEVGDATIQFLVNGQTEAADNEKSYSWLNAQGKAIGKDLLFKTILASLIGFELLFGLFLRNYDLPLLEPPRLAEVPKRFAKFIPPQQISLPDQQVGATTAGATGEQQEGEKKSGDAEKRQGRERRGGAGGGSAEESVSSKGLLALIGGTGESSHSGGAADFLIDQGLVQELDDLIGQTPLRKGDGYGRGKGAGIGDGQQPGDAIDDLMDMGLSGSIDDLIQDVQKVESVGLEKRGNVNIQAPGRIRGSESAMGYRTAESVMSVIRSQQGRVMYAYNKHLRTDPALGGKISLDVTIEANGQVSQIDVVETNISNLEFVRELVNILRRLKFETIPEGSLTVNVPFVFNRIE
ncbi:MAG TPA: AgmX/PglI C-terminal domain-containing protein [bacterium]|nr:AgmX/PglI C-terminal domain-containing protein [bacterium]HNT66586.1 AgmX/PglI C-terminal domain-containing protein [bacterium]